jgi:hypothetical protein
MKALIQEDTMIIIFWALLSKRFYCLLGVKPRVLQEWKLQSKVDLIGHREQGLQKYILENFLSNRLDLKLITINQPLIQSTALLV